MNTQPTIAVGIMAAPEIHFSLSGAFGSSGKAIPEGHYTATLANQNIVVRRGSEVYLSAKELQMLPRNTSGTFELQNVTIGVDFHWEQQENQQFRGGLKLIREEEKIRCINLIALEEYLQSVISSEMSAASSSELLKAHAIISRSWLLAQIQKSGKIPSKETGSQANQMKENERIRWYDREDHVTFDVCADDHCQRYQGITKIISEKARQAVTDTEGEVLVSEGEICDARYAKCCGGITENFENVWEPVPHPYLSHIVDAQAGNPFSMDLRNNDEAEKWIRSSPQAFCNTSGKHVLSQVLPDFDQATTDFYRWKVTYTQKQLSELIRKRSGCDFGKIIKLEAVERGYSGRLVRLKIMGTKKTLILGKELEIRKWLSESHLYSSAFVVDHEEIKNGIPRKFILNGAGWGHGVGLCQIGAAVMGEKGYSYQQILKHYFKGTSLEKQYTVERI